MKWSPEQIADLRRRLEAGESYATIAQAYGRTRGAMAEAIRRLRKTWGDALPAAKPRLKKRVVEPVADVVAGPGVSLLECEGCRWPVGRETETLFCDAPRAEGRSYCDTHHAQAHVPTAFLGFSYAGRTMGYLKFKKVA